MDDCTYNHIRVLQDLALVHAFLHRHCHKDAKSKKHNGCCKNMEALHKDVKKHMRVLQNSLVKHKI